MSRIYREKILNGWALLEQCYNACVQNFSEQSAAIVLDTLVTCQDAAYVIGNNLERHWGEETPVVSQIGSLCESLYVCHKKILEGTISKQDWLYVQDEIKTIETQLELDLSDKIEMVFLPYKASMWDSLESVWKAACESEDCEAYVVPIPYFDKTKEGKFGQEHYEIDQYPDDVPTINYEEYNMEERCPDIVFIHNPYDDYNRVTTIHPNYYVKELKQYVGKVVYIPYYVSNEFNPSDLIVQKDKAAFVMTPGVIFSDYTIVQSENTRQLYLNILRKQSPDVDWETKILGLGSPKIDRIQDCMRDDSKLPEEWRKIIYDRNGERKRVVFYNTSLAALLNCGNMLDKIEDTLKYFAGKKEVVLWWRPHPLYEATLESIMPAQVDRYKKIVQKYKDGGIGIFDDGMDLSWAITETDMYYGDESSVAVLFKNVSKPVMYQNTGITNCGEENSSIPMWPSTYYVDDESVWFVHGKINMLCKLDLKTLRYELIGSVPDENLYQFFLYKGMLKYNNKIVLVPGSAKKIAIYNIEKGNFEKIEFQHMKNFWLRSWFEDVEIWNGYLLCYPSEFPDILKIRLETNEVERINVLGNELENQTVVFYDRVRIGNCVYMVCDRTKAVFKVNIEDGTVEKLDSPMNEQYTNIIAIKGELVLYSASNRKIIVWKRNGQASVLIDNMVTGRIKMYSICDEYILIEKANGESFCVDINGTIIQKRNKEIKRKKSFLGFDTSYLILGKDISDRYSCFDTSNYSLKFFDRREEKDEFIFNDTVIEKMPSSQMEMTENELCGLVEWMDVSRMENDVVHEQETSGDRIIYKLISKEKKLN